MFLSGSIVAVKLTTNDLKDIPAKFAPAHGGPWVVIEQFDNGVTYRGKHPVYGDVRQVPIRNLKLLALPEEVETPAELTPVRHEGEGQMAVEAYEIDDESETRHCMGPLSQPQITVYDDKMVEAPPPEVAVVRLSHRTLC